MNANKNISGPNVNNERNTERTGNSVVSTCVEKNFVDSDGTLYVIHQVVAIVDRTLPSYSSIYNGRCWNPDGRMRELGYRMLSELIPPPPSDIGWPEEPSDLNDSDVPDLTDSEA
jgi:hypothetical protein